MRYTFSISDKNARALEILNELKGNRADFICAAIIEKYDKMAAQKEMMKSMQDFFNNFQPAATQSEAIKEKVIDKEFNEDAIKSAFEGVDLSVGLNYATIESNR